LEPEHTNNGTHEGHDALEIGLALELDAELFRLLTGNDSVVMQVRSTVEQYVAGFIAALGIPGVPRLEITAPAESSPQNSGSEGVGAGEQFLRLSAHGQVCAYSDELLGSVYSYMELSPLLLEATPAYILSWLQKLLRDSEDMESSERTRRVAEFFGLVCVEILKIRPSVLVAPAQVAAYCALLANIEEGQDTTRGRMQPLSDWLLPVLHMVLDMYLPIADIQAVAFVLSYSNASQASPEDTGEQLIAYLLAQDIEIQMPQDYLKELTTSNVYAGRDKFTTLRKELFDEFGIRYPAFRFVPDEHLKPSCFAFKLNAVTTLPFVGLKAQQGLLPTPIPAIDNDAPMIINPLSGGVESLIEFKPEDTEYSSSRKQLDYFMLCFKATLKKHKTLFVHQSFVADQCKKLREYHPILVNTVKAKISDERLTRILRALVMKNASIRDWRFLFERLLDYLYMSADPANNSILVYWMTTPLEEKFWSDEPENVVSFLRDSMKRTDILSV
jgi:hypothetical protein